MSKQKTKPVEMTMLSIPRTLHARIRELAKADGRSMRSYMDILITSVENNKIKTERD